VVCTPAKLQSDPKVPVALSPDKKKAAFIRAFNLWIRDMDTGKETQLTTDGVKDYGYATHNAGWIQSDDPILVWSPDSKKIATFQQDQLIKANKDFDLLMIPNAGHGYGAASRYMTRRRWDYFVRYLAGAIPPPEYEMKPYSEVQAALSNGPEELAQ